MLVFLLAPEVSNRPLPAPDAVGPLIGGLAIAITVLSLVWIGVRKIRRRGTQGARRSIGGTGIGNALFELGSVLQPDRPNVETIVRIEEEGVEDDLGDGRDPGRKPTPPRHRGSHPDAPPVESGPPRDKAFKPGDPIVDDPDRGREHL